MSDQFIGEIRLFGFPRIPDGWLPCDGRPLSISQYQTLFALIGTTYGGDGVQTFNVPDLRGRVPIARAWDQVFHLMRSGRLAVRTITRSLTLRCPRTATRWCRRRPRRIRRCRELACISRRHHPGISTRRRRTRRRMSSWRPAFSLLATAWLTTTSCRPSWPTIASPTPASSRHRVEASYA